MVSKLINHTGERFGRLVVIRRFFGTRRGEARWMCGCDCGMPKIVSGNHLRSGDTKSCGCLRRELTIKRNTTHGMRHSVEYRIYKHLMDRCYRKSDKRFKDYGGRGIAVCKKWHKFENFYKDMGPRPEGLTIERIDNNRDYKPSNCRWATWYDQADNRRNNINITIGNETKNLARWCKIRNIPDSTVRNRIKSGMSPIDALMKGVTK